LTERKHTLLVVEDDRILQEQLRELLGFEMKEIYQAFDGKEGLSIFKDKKPDIILTDLSLPEMDGFSMIKKIREIDRDQPIVVLSAHSHKETLLKALDLSVNGYLLKPLQDIDLLKAKLREQVQNAQHRKDKHDREKAVIKKHYEDQVKKMHYRSFYDHLTRIPNRFMFQQMLSRTIKTAKQTHSSFSLLFVDMDNLKIINDTFGHKVGDYMIKYFVNNIKETIGPNDFLARIGGDEFAIIIETENNKELLSKIAQKIIAAAAKKTYFKGQPIGVTCSIGISIYPDDTEYADELVEFADKAMYDVKVSGKHGYRFHRDASR